MTDERDRYWCSSRAMMFRAVDDGIDLFVKVVPGASRTGLAGTWRNRLKVAVAAPPERGKANTALTRFIASLMGLRKQDVTVVAGRTSPLKTVRLTGVTTDQARRFLELD